MFYYSVYPIIANTKDDVLAGEWMIRSLFGQRPLSTAAAVAALPERIVAHFNNRPPPAATNSLIEGKTWLNS